jgi:RNA polymerase sigma-70 factor (ECF subfamily)
VSVEERFDALFRSTYRRILGYCLRRAPEAVAHDITAEVFSVAWRRRADLPVEDEAIAWLIAIARRLLANEERGRRRRERLRARLFVLSSGPPSRDRRDEVHSPLKVALDSLSSGDREIIALSYWDQLSHAEIAEVLDITDNAVAVRLHRARERLKQRLLQSTPEEEDRCRPTI